ncbi:MAG: alanine--glyoxylate aminotransferase family protein [Anaerolineae bacterium]|nr:alanine--glyoxylate aminotransferase family protein [Anaerolineae bacterium]
MDEYPALAPLPGRLLMGPGPSNVHPRVLAAMATPLLGHLDPAFLEIMNRTRDLLKYVFQTGNELTLPVAGTGSAGMEASLCNLIEEGDEIVIAVNGYFGERLSEMALRCRASLRRLEVPWGEVFRPEQVEEALRERPPKVLAMVHAETSTGALQPVEEMARLAHEYGALFLLDTVTSLGGVPVEVDRWGVDACYSGTQKCLSCPPGLAPITFSPGAREALHRRRSKVQSWYLDLGLIEQYWGQERIYHHTAPISMNYALYEALRLIREEGLAARFSRHRLNAEALWAGLEAMGLELLVPLAYRLPTLNAVCVPEGVNDARVRSRLLNEHGIEIGGGLGELKGRIWRVGLMGHSSTGENVLQFLGALERVLRAEGLRLSPHAGVEAAASVLQRAASS